MQNQQPTQPKPVQPKANRLPKKAAAKANRPRVTSNPRAPSNLPIPNSLLRRQRPANPPAHKAHKVLKEIPVRRDHQILPGRKATPVNLGCRASTERRASPETAELKASKAPQAKPAYSETGESSVHPGPTGQTDRPGQQASRDLRDRRAFKESKVSWDLSGLPDPRGLPDQYVRREIRADRKATRAMPGQPESPGQPDQPDRSDQPERSGRSDPAAAWETT